MGTPYRIAIYFKYQIGLMIGYTDGFILLKLPFCKVMLNITKDAEGFNLLDN